MTCTASVDELACAGHGDCAVVAPDVFEIEDIAIVVGSAPRDVLIEAARACPSAAIAVIDDATGEQLYP
jgi:ferredoxin